MDKAVSANVTEGFNGRDEQGVHFLPTTGVKMHLLLLRGVGAAKTDIIFLIIGRLMVTIGGSDEVGVQIPCAAP